MAAIECESVVRIYRGGGLEVQALQGLDLRIEEGELTALVGASGSGKSTLMAILAGLDAPSAGSVRVAGRDVGALKGRERVAYRRQTIGFLWQSPGRNLLPYLTAAENVALPQRFAGVRRRARRARALELLDQMGVAHCRDRTPATMSGGEQQRAAIAVALANRPAVLLADEPTGELDSDSAEQVIRALQTANTEQGVTILTVTHDAAISGQVRRTVAIRDGRTSTETLRGSTEEHGAVEYAVIDRAGRLQIPHEFLDPLGIRDRVRLTHETGHVGVWPHANGTAVPEQPTLSEERDR